MPTFLLQHHHDPGDCRFAYAAWNGFASPLRHGTALSSCREGGHVLWWTVDAPDAPSAIAQLPPFVGERAAAVRVSEVRIP